MPPPCQRSIKDLGAVPWRQPDVLRGEKETEAGPGSSWGSISQNYPVAVCSGMDGKSPSKTLALPAFLHQSRAISRCIIRLVKTLLQTVCLHNGQLHSLPWPCCFPLHRLCSHAEHPKSARSPLGCGEASSCRLCSLECCSPWEQLGEAVLVTGTAQVSPGLCHGMCSHTKEVWCCYKCPQLWRWLEFLDTSQ